MKAKFLTVVLSYFSVNVRCIDFKAIYDLDVIIQNLENFRKEILEHNSNIAFDFLEQRDLQFSESIMDYFPEESRLEYCKSKFDACANNNECVTCLESFKPEMFKNSIVASVAKGFDNENALCNDWLNLFEKGLVNENCEVATPLSDLYDVSLCLIDAIVSQNPCNNVYAAFYQPETNIQSLSPTSSPTLSPTIYPSLYIL
mmetsp:Transcript_2061/g.2740  ORF Transcript_2061/g.2740 Transcript_2061/m.2740 type:complete len:201 (+) Transcript_2061:55-657(+)